MKSQVKNLLEIEIDCLTNSIRNTISGDVLNTEIFPLTLKSFNEIIKGNWLFDWKKEIKQNNRQVFKLVIENNETIIQGLLSISIETDHIYMHLIENARFNKGKHKLYEGVPGNLVAFACKLSFENKFDGYVSFDAKTALIKHYEETLFATHFKGTKMYIDTIAAKRLINQYFNK
ncbi:MAG: hypothetical protein WCH34_12290 [Bacteroidota bacterium]